MADETTPTAKPWWQSKTVWLNVLALLSMAVPAVREWADSNPVEPMAALTALNVLVRFVTSGRISIFGEDDSSGGSSSGVGASGGKAGGAGRSDAADYRESRRTRGVPWLVVSACAMVCLLTACTVGVDAEGGWSVRPDPRTIDAGLRYLIRQEEDEAKGGLTQWKYYDPATGEEIAEEDYAAWGIKP